MRLPQTLSTVALAATLFSCGDANPLYCQQNSDCNNANLPFCDRDGVFPDSNGVRNTCIADPIVLDVTVVGSGSVTSNPGAIDCGSTCSEAFATDTPVTLSAVADTGAVFTGWSGACTNSTGDCGLTMSASQSVTATFVNNVQLTVVIADSSPGSVGQITSSPAGIDCPGACTADFLDGSPVILSATEGAGSTFMGWSGAGCNGLADCTVTVGPGAKTVDASFVEAGVFGWARTGGDSGTEQGVDVAYDSQGNLILVVNFTGILNMGGQTFNRTQPAMYIGKFDPQGNELWSWAMSNSSGWGVTVNDNDDVYLAGESNGFARVRRLLGTTGIQNASYGFNTGYRINDIDIDSVGNVVLASTITSGDTDAAVIWLRPNLQIPALAFNFYGGAGDQSASGIAVTSTDTVLVTGRLAGTVDFNANATGGTLTSSGPNDSYFAEVGPGSSLVWLKGIFGNTGTVQSRSVAVDPADNAYFSGNFSGAVDFAPNEPGGDLDAAGAGYLIKYSATGNHLSSQQFVNSWIVDVQTDDRGNVLLTGGYSGITNFGGGALPSFGGNFDIFVASLQGDGSHRWSRGVGSGSDFFLPWEVANAIAVAPSGDVAATGPFQGTVDFGGGQMASGGGTDAFVFVRSR